MDSDPRLNCRLLSRVIPLSNSPRLVYLLMELGGGEGGDTLPGNLAFILDVSESMRIRLVTNEQFMELARRGQAREIMSDGVPAYQIHDISSDMVANFPRRLDYVMEALTAASEYLRPVDRFSVVAFAGRATCLLAGATGKERGRLRQAASELEFLSLGDGTQMAQGLELGFSEVQSRHDESQAGRLILLTDGHTQNVKECYTWARRMRNAGLKLTTMGIGTEFNEDLLIPLADLTGGNAYYIERPEQIPDAFRQELGAALHVSYRNVEVKLQLEAGAELRRAYRVLPELGEFDAGPNMDSSYALLLGDYDPSQPVSLLLEIVTPPLPKGNHRLAQVMLAWDSPSKGLLRQNQRQEIEVLASRVATAPVDEHVMNVVEKISAFKMGMSALQAAQNAAQSDSPVDKNAATIRLRQAATRLLSMGENELADAMYRQATNMESSGSLDPDEAKRLRYQTRRLSQHL